MAHRWPRRLVGTAVAHDSARAAVVAFLLAGFKPSEAAAQAGSTAVHPLMSEYGESRIQTSGGN